MDVFDVRVRGAGIVGKTLALALANSGLRVQLLGGAASPGAPADVRAFALNAASIALLQRLKVWQALPPNASTPVVDMHVHGDRADAALDFSAWEQRTGALACIVDAAVLEDVLSAAVRYAPRVTRLDGDARSVTPGPPRATRRSSTREAPSRTLTALCEGRESAHRNALGVVFESHSYGQRAIAARLTSSRAHGGAAHQWFRLPDVLALLPFDAPSVGHSFALVWSLPDGRAADMGALDDRAFTLALMDATDGAAGELELASRRMSWPLAVGVADRWCGDGWVLLGDAAHTIHPLAGQGLNLGMADVAALVGEIGAREPWRALGDERLLRRYVRRRAAATWAMRTATDGLLRLFSHEGEGFRGVRNHGLVLANKMSPFKRWLAARALDS